MGKLDAGIHLRVPTEVKEALEARAALLDRSLGWVIREALEAYVRDLKEQQRG